jgi:hypothetical protein
MEVRQNVAAYADLNARQPGWVQEAGCMALFNPSQPDGLIKIYPVVTGEDETEDK